MARRAGSALMFDEDDVRNTTSFLPRLIRMLFYTKRITNETFIQNYKDFFRNHAHKLSRKAFTQQASSDRGSLLDEHSLTFKKMDSVSRTMGFDIKEVSMVFVDRLTGEELRISTDDTVESLDERYSKPTEFGVTSIM